MVVRFVCAVRVPLCVRVSRECPAPPGLFHIKIRMNIKMTGVAAVVDAAVSVVLIDLNNVRGELGFPPLHATLAAARLWADRCACKTLVVVVARISYVQTENF